jgi:hypothetical protein
MMSCWPARTLEGSVMLLAAASSPVVTWYLRAMMPRLSPGCTVCLTASMPARAAAGFSAPAGLAAAGAAARSLGAAPGLPGMISFLPGCNVAPVLRLLARASSETVSPFFFARFQRLSPLATV